MTKIETIISEIERLKEIGCPLQKGSDYQHGYDEFYTQIKTFIDSLPSKEPNKDLEEEIDRFQKAKYGGDVISVASIARHFAQLQKEHMMKGLCYETKVYRDEEGDGIDTPIESWLALENNEIMNLPDIGLKDGDKVKVIIVKEDEQ